MITNANTLREMVSNHVAGELALFHTEMNAIQVADFDAIAGTLRAGMTFDEDTFTFHPNVEELKPFTVSVLNLWLEVRGLSVGPLFTLPQ
jgi:hypothetical protein